MTASNQQYQVGLFVTCLVDVMRPSVGFAALQLLEDAGCAVHVPQSQTCCGQPGYNSGDKAGASAVAKQVIAAFEGFDYVVAPSGSCAGMIARHYPELLQSEPDWHRRALALARRTYELTAFLNDVLKAELPPGDDRRVAYHDSCSSLREMGAKAQPRALLGARGVTVEEHSAVEDCCGFGGLFCVKYPEISEKMVDRKLDSLAATGADTVLAGDLGCLMNMAGRASRRGMELKFRHVAEVLAGDADTPAIGEAE